MAQHIVVNITWQENYWTGEPSPEDMQRAGHRYARSNIGHEYLNFNLERDVKDGYKIGYFQATRQPTRFSSGRGNIFFYSGGYVVGIYGQAEVGSFERLDPPPNDSDTPGNIRAPIEKVCRFKDIRLLKLDPNRHLGGKKKVGQIGFTYIDDNAARNILDDAIDLHEEGSAYRQRLKKVRLLLEEAETKRHIWKIAPGENASQWEACRENDYIGIGWELGDYRQYDSKAAINQALGGGHDNSAKSIWYFAREIASGDIIVANKGIRTVVGIGRVISDYLPSGHPQNPNLEFANARRVDWKITEPVGLDFALGISTVLPVRDDQWAHIKQQYLAQNPALQSIFDELEGRIGMPFKDEVLEATLNKTRNVILYGPPGTGKTYRARRVAEAWTQGQVTKKEDHFRVLTFHQSYGYEDFVEGLRPIVDPQGNIRYEGRSGIFKQMCDEAAADPDNKFVLIIDEINRGNIAKIFGELITLLEDDKRLGQENEMRVLLPESQQHFGVPDNLYLLGTMNTADRSIALLDIALRRRFTFVEIGPDPSLLQGKEIEGVPLDKLLDRLNLRIEALLDRDHRLGHSYFMEVEDIERLHYVWYNKLIPLLQEYFYNDGERLRAVLDDFVEQQPTPHNLFAHPPETFDPELASYRVITMHGTQFIAVLKRLVGLIQ